MRLIVVYTHLLPLPMSEKHLSWCHVPASTADEKEHIKNSCNRPKTPNSKKKIYKARIPVNPLFIPLPHIPYHEIPKSTIPPPPPIQIIFEESEEEELVEEGQKRRHRHKKIK